MKPFRSMLFLPANKPDWVAKAFKAGPDGIILDMEDAVAKEHKVTTRSTVRKILEDWKCQNVFISVRVNAFDTNMTFDDLENIICAGLSDIMLPKVEKAEDLFELSILLKHLERRAGLPEGKITITPLLETALGMQNAYEIAVSSPRIKTILPSASPRGDAARALGYIWSEEGKETLFLRSKILLNTKAAGRHPMIFSWSNIKDLQGLERDARLNRQLGYKGMVVIHPSHVEVVNRVFTPTKEELIFFKNLLTTFEEAERRGEAAISYQGALIDAASLKTAKDFIQFAKSIGIEI